MGATNKIRFETYEGNTRNLPFQLRRRGVKGPWDVSTATSIVLEITDPDGTDATPLALADGGLASWVDGLVIAPISQANVTGARGTWTFSVTVSIGGEVLTSGTGEIEVLDRPGFTLP